MWLMTYSDLILQSTYILKLYFRMLSLKNVCLNGTLLSEPTRCNCLCFDFGHWIAALSMTLNCKQYPSNSDKPCLSSSTCVSDLNTKLTGSHQVKHSYHWITAQRNKIQNRPEHPFIHPSLHSSLHPGAQRWICSPSHDLKWTPAIPKLCSGRGLTVENKPRPWKLSDFPIKIMKLEHSQLWYARENPGPRSVMQTSKAWVLLYWVCPPLLFQSCIK